MDKDSIKKKTKKIKQTASDLIDRAKTYRPFDRWRTAPIKEESRKQVLSTHYFDVDLVSLEAENIGHFARYVLRENDGDTVAVLAITDDGRIPLVEQYRIPNHSWTLELPAGHAVKKNERALDVARRKLRDEAGYEAESFDQFVRFVNTPSFSTQHTVVYRATGLKEVERTMIGPESPVSNVRLVPVQEAYEMVLNGTIVDAKSVIAIQHEHIKMLEEGVI
ncbi:ADP-ribose pyrophosphatase [Pseudoscardovia radai]|uniref:ADP-ribose pyrophosphatase n=1 Tax=Pseudoscardovia radai TaxID=987066 RepID=A0A261EUB9_9BIFI|nr:NUDIX hydrolase [Pseudoscardovia radai]MDO5688124.1 NUDIX hydrolase [Pseudoscardovia radai]OZG50464.1 ADP-ribose pyrophosphatase [Pseudoscardovia radai]